MILLAFAAAAAMQWTGPRTVEYEGPGNFCGGGYLISLARGDRALILPQGHGGAQATRLVLGGREVNLWNGAPPQGGRIVLNYRGSAVSEQNDRGAIGYTVLDETNFALYVTSAAFRGFKKDAWFFRHANFNADADQGADCLAARSF